MGQALAEAFPESREVFEAADRALGTALSKTWFEGTAEELSMTETTQPAVLTVSVAALRALEARSLRPVAAAGHSLGEYSAHVAAGTLGFEDAVRTVRQRGTFMQQAVPVGQGAMAAVMGLSAQQVAEVCAEVAGDEVVAPANLNGPSQVVIAGHAAAVQRAVERAREAGALKAVPLPVSAPFHSELMQPAAERLADVLRSVEMSAPSFPMYTNVDARPVESGEAARDALVRQVTSPVRWEELVQAMVAAGIEQYVEVGPGKVLAGLLRRIHKPARVMAASDPEGVERVVREWGKAA